MSPKLKKKKISSSNHSRLRKVTLLAFYNFKTRLGY